MLTRDAETAVEVITALGGRAFVVGGWLRDELLGVESKDVDIEAHGVAPGSVLAALSEVGRVDAVGMAFGVLKFGRDVDISFPRRDSKSGDGHTGFYIEFDQDMSVEDALSRRDFTINSMAFDPLTGEMIDPFGGLSDLKHKIIRATNHKKFGDDPLRVLRAVQFASRFGFRIDPATAKICYDLWEEFPLLSKERIWMEWEKILTKGKSLSAVVGALRATGWYIHFPQFLRAKVTFADLVLKTAQDVDPQRRAAIALGACFVNDETDRLRMFLHAIDAPLWLRHASQRLAKHYKEAVRLDDGGADVESRLVARALGRHVRLRDWLLVHWLQDSPLAASAERQGILDAPKPRLLTGDDLIGLGMTPGPQFGPLLKAAEQAQDLHGWTYKTQALAWLEE